MRKLILGIAVVICLDLAFILAMMSDVESFELAKIVETPIVNPMSVARRLEAGNLPTVDETAVQEVDETENGKYRAPNATRPFRRLETARKTNKIRSRSVANGYAPAVKFEDTIIWFERKNYTQEESFTPKVTMRSKPEKSIADRPVEKKKSFFSRALPVVTKPYDWLKSFASKLR